MNVNYIDPSAWVKRYFAENGTESVATIFQGADSIACSRFGLIEVAATIARKGGAEKLAPGILRMLLEQGEKDFISFDSVSVSDALLSDAQHYAFHYGLRAGDALRLVSAMAITKRDGVSSVSMISADKELLAASLQLGLRIVNPQ